MMEGNHRRKPTCPLGGTATREKPKNSVDRSYISNIRQAKMLREGNVAHTKDSRDVRKVADGKTPQPRSENDTSVVKHTSGAASDNDNIHRLLHSVHSKSSFLPH